MIRRNSTNGNMNMACDVPKVFVLCWLHIGVSFRNASTIKHRLRYSKTTRRTETDGSFVVSAVTIPRSSPLPYSNDAISRWCTRSEYVWILFVFNRMQLRQHASLWMKIQTKSLFTCDCTSWLQLATVASVDLHITGFFFFRNM